MVFKSDYFENNLKQRIIVRKYELTDRLCLHKLIHALYIEDSSNSSMTNKKIEMTIEKLSANTEKGKILLFDLNDETIGYSILINYWSNEYGGNILFIDEIYILPEHRNNGIATSYFAWLKTQMKDTKALQLEVIPGNQNALRLYIRLGFKPTKNNNLRLEF
jgi:ribosomal protein S18 acetylase RimI-like enzyme